MALAALLVISWPALKLTAVHNIEVPVWYVIVAKLVFFVLLDDFLHYWMHRYMHENKWLLRNLHSVHHRVRNTCGINGNYMHWLEYTLTAAVTLIGPILFGVHIYVVWLWVIIRQIEGADGHIGYDTPWNPVHLLPVYQGPARSSGLTRCYTAWKTAQRCLSKSAQRLMATCLLLTALPRCRSRQLLRCKTRYIRAGLKKSF